MKRLVVSSIAGAGGVWFTARIVESGRPVDGTVLFGRALTVGGLCTATMLAAAPLIQGLLCSGLALGAFEGRRGTQL
jgi:hypothetical protein